MKKLSLKSIMIACASVLGCIGTFLSWGNVKVLSYTASVMGTAGDGWLTFIAFLAIAAIAAAFILKEAMPTAAKSVITALGVGIIVFAIIKVVDINSIGFGASAGLGLYWIIIFGLVAAALPWIPFNKMLGKK